MAAASAVESGHAVPGALVCDGQPACVHGTFVRVSSEYVGWDVFKKFKGKVGMLTWRHFSGMWYADFPGEDEYGFLCGPLLFQLQYSSEKEAHESAQELEKLRKERDMQNALETEKSKQLVNALEKRAKEMSATTTRLFEQLAIIQEEMRKTEMDMGRMERAFTDLTAHANVLDAELAATRAERDSLQSANGELQKQLHDSKEDVDRLANRVKELVSENTKHQADLEYEKGERELLARELEEKAERMNALDSESKALKEQVATLDAELGTSKAHAAIMEENFLAARQEAADASAKADQLSMTLKELEDAALQGGGMTRAEREALMAKLEQSQRDLAEANRKVEEANTKLDDVINDEQLFKRLASAKHGPATGPAGKGANQESHLISEDELVALQEQAFRADEAERELDKMRSKLMLMEEDSKNGKKVPGLLKEIESLNEKINKQKDLAERHRQEHNRIVTDLKNHKIQVKSLTVETEKLQSELSKLQEELRKLQTKVEEQDHRIALLQGELEVMTNEEGAQRSRADSLSEEKDRLIAEQTKMESLRADREKTISELESAAEQMRQEAKRLNNTKTELEKQFRHAKSRITEVEERERKYKEQSETTMRKLEGRLEELQDQLKNLGQVRVQFNDLQKKYMADLGESNAKIEELTKQFQNVSVELAETKSLADAHQKIVGLYYHKINHKISVPPRKVLFKVWHLFTVACKYWNADERHKAMEAAVRKSKYESKSLRLRLGAAHRLVEEMQRRDKSISCASTLLAPPPSVDGSETAKASERLVASDCSSVLGASDGPSVQHLKGPGAIGGTSATSTDRSAYGKSQDTSPTLRAPDKDAAMKDTKVQDQAHGPEGGNEVQQHARAASSEHSQDSAKQCTQCSEIEGIKQRNTRLQANVMKLEEQAKKLGEHNDDLNAQLMDLKKQMSLIGCLRLAEKLTPALKDRKTAVEARTLCQSMSVALLDKERSIPLASDAGAANQVSSIQARKAELENEAAQRGSTLEQETKARMSSKYRDMVQVAQAEGDNQKSIFEQLDLLTGQVSDLVARHDTHHMRRYRQEMQMKEDLRKPLPFFAANAKKGAQGLVSSLKNSVSANQALPPAPKSLPPRPQTAHA